MKSRLLISSFFCVLTLFSKTTSGQNKLILKGHESKFYCFLDTLKVSKPYVTVNVKWISDTIQIRKWTYDLNIDSALVEFKKAARITDWFPSEMEKQGILIRKKIAAQNCYSNALEHYFEFKNLNFNKIFNDSTSIVDMSSFEKILNNSFALVKRFSTKKKSKINKLNIENGSFIVLRNKSRKPIHSIFYEKDIFYSKNGQNAETKYKRLKDIIKRYFDTIEIEIYELNESSIFKFISNKNTCANKELI
ncbi:hypothetical protein [Hyunsoonleella ulvae]|uniref:hypothetical protein n=1 Tax=Hyunsoonleella ulvae TaxID=2799948 RepID=UPI0019399D49|nr:hypothetical protein [Hyunsoonleella ulvae]